MAARVSHRPPISAAAEEFIDRTRAEAEFAFRALRETGTLSASGTLTFIERVPDEEQIVVLRYPGPFSWSQEITVTVTAFDGGVLRGDNAGGGTRYLPLFTLHPAITTVSHVHTPYLGAWAQTHFALPIKYVAAQRHTLAREIPVYIDRRESETAFILRHLRDNPSLPAILEANGGTTFWGREGLLKTAQYILLLEEGAKFQLLAESLGGSVDYGPGVLEQQWSRTGLISNAAE